VMSSGISLEFERWLLGRPAGPRYAVVIIESVVEPETPVAFRYGIGLPGIGVFPEVPQLAHPYHKDATIHEEGAMRANAMPTLCAAGDGGRGGEAFLTRRELAFLGFGSAWGMLPQSAGPRNCARDGT
jgi:hypothetical protein